MQSSIDGANDRLPIYPLRVMRVDPGDVFHVRTLSEKYRGCFTHYKGQSRYCAGEKECRPDLHRLDRFWKGYCAVELWDGHHKKWFPFVLELTESLELDFRGLYKRGQVWEVWRPEQKTKKKTPVQGKMLEQLDERTLPNAFDYIPVLRSMYHVERISLDETNPMPPRVIVQPSEGAPPPNQNPEPEKHLSADSPEWRAFMEKLNGRKKTPSESGKR